MITFAIVINALPLSLGLLIPGSGCGLKTPIEVLQNAKQAPTQKECIYIPQSESQSFSLGNLISKLN